MTDSEMPTDTACQQGIFIETSAHIARLTGSRAMRDSINALLESFPDIGTSQFVVDEFVMVIGGLYGAVVEACQRLRPVSTRRSIQALWAEIEERLPHRIPGGAKRLAHLAVGIAVKYATKPVSPRELAHTLHGQKLQLLDCVQFKGTRKLRRFDRSSCCVWPINATRMKRCSITPAESCELHQLCSAEWSRFRSSMQTLAGARCDERRWLQKNMHTVATLEGLPRLEKIGKHVNAFGDIIIFLELPGGWTALTRDAAYGLLQRAHRADVRILFARLPRNTGSHKCVIKTKTATVQGTITNWTTGDACIVTEHKLSKPTDVVSTTSTLFGRERRFKIKRVRDTRQGVEHGGRFLP